MQTPNAMKIDLNRVVVCNRQPLKILEEVLKFNWVHGKTQAEKDELMQSTLPSFASGAVRNNDFIALQVLLEEVDVNDADYDGNTPLHTACEMGNVDMVRFLLGRGASPEVVNLHKQCPMQVAIKNRHFKVIELLRWKGITVKLHPVRIGMALIKAVRTSDYAALHAWFLSGVDMDTPDYDKRTAMDEAERLGESTIIAKLQKYRATPLSSVPESI